MRKNLGVVLGALALAFSLGGCATQPIVCGLAGISYEIEVAAGAAENIRVCVDAAVGCATSTEESSTNNRISIQKNADGTFTVTADFNPPPELTVTSLDAAGEQLDTQTFPLEWSPEPQYEPCGPGHAETDPITL